MEECPICQSEIKEKVSMTCSAKHSFCFECILKSVESCKELKNCPMCRGGGENKSILLESESICKNSENFYSVSKFKKFIPIIQKILNTEEKSQNSCLISDSVLLTYVKNKKQLEFADILSKTYSIDEIFPLIKWTDQTSLFNWFLRRVPDIDEPARLVNNPNISFGTAELIIPRPRQDAFTDRLSMFTEASQFGALHQQSMRF
jgi:hypothetical protein